MFLVRQDGVRINDSTSSSCELDIEIVFDSKLGVRYGGDFLIQGSNLKISPAKIANADQCNKESTVVSSCCEPLRNHSPQASFVSAAPNRMEESIPACPDVVQPLIYHWPGIKKMTKFTRSDLDSKSAFAIFSQTTPAGKSEDRFLYFWIGRFFRDKSWIQLNSSRVLGYREDIDWQQVGYDVLTQMGLPKDTPLKIVIEDEEPTEFLALLTKL